MSKASSKITPDLGVEIYAYILKAVRELALMMKCERATRVLIAT